MKIIRAKDYAELSKKAANIMAAQIINKPDCVLGLATGSSPIGLYKELIKKYENGDISFSKVRTINLDEYRGITKDNDQSYYYFMNDNLFSHVDIKAENTNIPNGENPDAEAECARYDAVIESFGGADIQLLGIGHDGHIGFNEPSDHFEKGTNCIDLTQMTIEANARFFASIDDVPKQAYTMGCGSIMKAKTVLLVANGKAKADIIYKAACGEVTPQIPASILQMHPNAIFVCDDEALSVVAEKCPEMISEF